MQITYKVAMEVAHHEAVIRQTYRDSENVLTWSVGLTSATGHNVKRYINNPQSMHKCLEVFIWALDRYAEDVRREFADHPLTEAQFAAALSFHWNTGDISEASWVKRWKAYDISGARLAFMWYDKPASIIERRKKERDLFFDGRWSGDGKMLEYTELTSRMDPVWRSGVKRDVSKELKAILEGTPTPVDYVEDDAHSLGSYNPPEGNAWAAFKAAIMKLFGKVKT